MGSVTSRQTDQAQGLAPEGLVEVGEESGSGALAGRGLVHVGVGYDRPGVNMGEEHARGSHRTAPRKSDRPEVDPSLSPLEQEKRSLETKCRRRGAPLQAERPASDSRGLGLGLPDRPDRGYAPRPRPAHRSEPIHGS